MIDFILKYWQLILACFTACVDCAVLVVALLKRKVKIVDSAFEKVLEDLPNIIVAAEVTGLKGTDKLSVVVSSAISILCNLLGKDEDYVETHYLTRLTNAIESILKTPQKKGD